MSDTQEATKSKRLRAIMFADVIGYSRMMAEDEDGTSIRVSNIIRKFEKLGKAFNGELAQTRGDGLFFLFDSVTDSVRLAIEIENLTKKENEQIPESSQILFRIGIHLGEVMWVTNQYVGDSVNIASRIEGLAGNDGGICISGSVYEQVKHKLHLGFEFLGSLPLKNIPDPADVYRVSASTEEVLMAPSPRSRPVEPDLVTRAMIENKPKVAVLPFNNLSGDPAFEYFSDGITEDLITNLSRFQALAVISRASSFVYKNREFPLKEIGRALDAQYIVSGGIIQSGNKVRITVELADSRTNIAIWRERYNRDIEDIFDLQIEVADLISAAVAIKTQNATETLRSVQVPALIETYSLVLKGQQKIFKYNKEQNIQARALYQSSLDSQSDYSRAMASLSRTHSLEWRYSWSENPDEALERAYQLAQESVVVDPSDARGYGELGFVSLYRKEHDLSLSSFEKAINLNPNDTDILSNYADALAHCGRGEEAIQLLNRAILLNPFYPDQYLWYLAGTYFALKDYKKAIDSVKKMNSPAEGRRILAASYAYLGHQKEAEQQAKAVLDLYPNFRIDHWRQVLPDTDQEVIDHFVEGLQMAGLR